MPRQFRVVWYVSSCLNFCKDCLVILLRKFHELYSYSPDCKKGKKLEPAFRLTLIYPKHIIIYLGSSLTGGKYQLHLRHLFSHQNDNIIHMWHNCLPIPFLCQICISTLRKLKRIDLQPVINNINTI